MKKSLFIAIGILFISSAYAITAQEAAQKCTAKLKANASNNTEGVSDSKLKEKAAADFDSCMAGYGFKR